MAQRRDSRGRFASSGAAGASRRRNARRIANSSGPDAGRAAETQSRAMAGAKRVKIQAQEKGDRKVLAQRTMAAQTYDAAVSRRSGLIATRKFGQRYPQSAKEYGQSKQVLRDMTAERLAKTAKVVKANPNSSYAKEAHALARMAAAVGGTHPNQRVRRRRKP